MNISRLPAYIGINRLTHPLNKLAIHDAKSIFGYRPIIKCDARKFSNNSPGSNRTMSRKIIRKIGTTGGQQNLVRLVSNLLAPEGAAVGAASYAFVYITNIIEVTQWPKFLTASVGLLVAEKFIEGVKSSIRPEFDNLTILELKQEKALKQACLKAQIRNELDKWCLDSEGKSVNRIIIGTEDQKFNSDDYGFLEKQCFKKLRLDFESSLSRQDVIAASANKPEGFTCKKRLLGEWPFE